MVNYFHPQVKGMKIQVFQRKTNFIKFSSTSALHPLGATPGEDGDNTPW
jgi:hypothetical protein